MSKPKILIYDIETSPILAYIWRPGYNMTVTHDMIKKGQQTNIICICYKWHGEKKTYSLQWDKHQDSETMIEKFSKVVEQADVVLAHNGDRFDLKHINTQRLLQDKPPIAWPTSEDTLKMVKKHFNFASNRLDFLSKTFVGAGKDKMSFQDWVDIVENNCEKAMRKMIKYCKRDVDLLDQVFTKIKPHVTLKANRSLLLMGNTDGCPNCGVNHIIKQGFYVTKAGKWQKLKCQNCGHIFKGKKQKVIK